MKLSYKSLRDPQFGSAMRKLTNYPFKRQKTAYDVMKISGRIDQEHKVAQELFIKLLKQYAKLDEAGNFIPRVRKDADGKETPEPDTFVLDDTKTKDFDKAADEFAALEFEINWRAIDMGLLEECRLTAVELSMLEPLLAEEAQEEKGADKPAPLKSV